jgi:16S rRNA (adenine1518-N6/adenine1519-N6)-dimethyltransferase
MVPGDTAMALEPLHIPNLLRQYGLKPQKSLGQNFLADHNALLKIVHDSGVTQNDDVLEIGAGVGNLTRLLAVHARSVTAVELDRKLLPALTALTQPFTNVRVVNDDILSLSLSEYFSEPGYMVVANIPYYITSAVIRHLLETPIKPRRMILTIQREVAERILSQDEKMSLLSLSVQIYGTASIIHHIPASCFYPPPNVDSSVLQIDVDPEPRLLPSEVKKLFQLAHAGFNQKRKMLRNSLKSVLEEMPEKVWESIADAGIDLSRRPESLSLDAWITLTKVVMAVEA